ncbi:MAG: GNAT family N-acetyltransferase [Pseudomonadota bacterium]
MISIEVLPQPGAELIGLIESVPFGDEGLSYRRADVGRLLRNADRPVCFCARDEDSGAIRGSYVLTLSKALLDGRPVRSCYRGLLAVDETVRGTGVGRRLVDRAFDWLAEESRRDDSALLSWGLIEERNLASRRLLEARGAEELRFLQTQLVYRQWPRDSAAVIELDESQKHAYDAQRLSAAKGLALTAGSALPVFGLMSGDELVAAARVGVQELDLGEGGRTARFLHRHAYSRFAVLGKRYNRRAFRYLSIHDPLVRAERGSAWREFLSALLARHELHMAMFTLDTESQAAETLDEAGVTGRFAKATRSRLALSANAFNGPDDWRDRIRNTPVLGGPVL